MNLRDTLKAIEENEGVIDENMEKALAIGKEELEQKGMSYGFAIKEFEDTVAVAKKEIERIQNILDRNQLMADKLKDKIKAAMIEFDVLEIKTATLKLKVSTSKETVITNADVIPKQFLVSKTTYTPDKKAIKAAIEAGKVVQGAFVKTNKNLQIK